MLNKKLKKAISSVTMFATVVCLSGVSMLAPLAAKAATTIADGDVIKSNATNSDGTPTLGSLDVYIVKIVGNKKFKRLVLNPQVFASYGHLKWENIKTVSQAEEDSFATSSLVRVDGDSKVYALTPAGDTGAKSWVNVTADQFLSAGVSSDPDSIYTINSVDGGNYTTRTDITSVAELKSFYKDGSLPASATDGALKVSLSADTASAGNVPTGVGVEFLKFNLTASNQGDVTVDSVKLTSGGYGTGSNIGSIALYDQDGNRLNSTLKNIDSNGEATVNLGHFVVKAGSTEEVTVKAIASSAAIYTLGIDSADDINSDAKSISGSFPVEGNEMNAVVASGLATLNFAQDGATLSSVDLGDTGAVLSKFKVTGSGSDATINRISLKRDSSVANAAEDGDFENLALYVGSTKVATADGITNKYVTFNIADGIAVKKDATVKMSLRGDVIGGAAKVAKFDLVNDVDVDATSSKYPALIGTNYVGQSVTIDAGAVTLEKVNATSDKVMVGKDNVELGTIKITANSGKDANISNIQVNIAHTGDNAAAAAFTDIDGVELYDQTTGSTYDLTYVSGTDIKVYGNDDVDIDMTSGETHEFIVRCDTTDAANGNAYTVSMGSGNLTIKEVSDDKAITDITPTSVTLKKVTVQASGVDFTVKTLSNPKAAVTGSEGVEAIRFDVESTASDITVTSLTFDGSGAGAGNVLSSSLVSGFALYEAGNSTPIKEVGTSALSGQEVTFDDLSLTIPADGVKTYYVTVDLSSSVAAAGKNIKLALSGYAAEDADDSVYDTTHDTGKDGVIDTPLASARTINIVGVGTLAVSIDNTLSNSKKDVYTVAGTNSDVLAALKLKATNEDVEVTSAKVTANANVNSVFSRLYLVDANGKEVASTSKISSANPSVATFDNMSYVVSGEKYLYLKGTTYPIGEDQTGILDQAGLTFRFSDIAATGESSQDDLTIGNNDATIEAGEIFYEAGAATQTAVSKATGVLASRISSVSLETTGAGQTVNSKLVAGNQVIAIIKVTTDATTNTDSEGTAVKTALGTIKLDLSRLVGADAAHSTVISNATIQNADGSTTGGTVAVADGNSVSFTVSGSDYELASGTTAYFIVKADVTKGVSTGTNDDFLQAKLNNLDSTVAGTANFTWKDSKNATDKNALRLGYSNVAGVSMAE